MTQHGEIERVVNDTIVQVELEKLWQTACVTFDCRALAGLRPERVAATVRHEMQAALHSHIDLLIPGEVLSDQSFAWPATWWDALKARWFPGWAKRRWPVRLERHSVRVEALYPQVSVPRQFHIIRMMRDGEKVGCEWRGAR